MLPMEAWQKIVKTLGKEKKEIKTTSTLFEPPKTVMVCVENGAVTVFGIPNRIGGETIDEEVIITYEEFEKVFPIYFRKDRFDEKHKKFLKNEKYIYSIIENFALAEGDVGYTSLAETEEELNNELG